MASPALHRIAENIWADCEQCWERPPGALPCEACVHKAVAMWLRYFAGDGRVPGACATCGKPCSQFAARGCCFPCYRLGRHLTVPKLRLGRPSKSDEHHDHPAAIAV